MTTWRMRIALWITKATVKHPEYVVLIVFPLQQWLHERDSMLRYTYNVCHVTHFISGTVQTFPLITLSLIILLL
jgi:hypothetical protein